MRVKTPEPTETAMPQVITPTPSTSTITPTAAEEWTVTSLR